MPRCTVLAYQGPDTPGGSHSARAGERLRAQCRALATHARPVIPMSRVADALAGHASLPIRAVALGFDANSEAFRAQLLAPLARAGMAATLYVGERDRLEPICLRELIAGGLEIGARMSPLSSRRIDLLAERIDRLGQFIERIEQSAGARVAHIAYDFGDLDVSTRRILINMGLRTGVSTTPGHAGLLLDPMSIRRVAVTLADDPDRLAWKLWRGASPRPGTAAMAVAA